MNRTDTLVMQRQEQVNAVLKQANQQEENQQKHIKVAVLQMQKIQALEKKLEQQLANSSTRVRDSIQGWIPASIDTSGSLVTREEIQLMFTNFTKNLPTQTTCTEINPAGTKISGK